MFLRRATSVAIARAIDASSSPPVSVTCTSANDSIRWSKRFGSLPVVVEHHRQRRTAFQRRGQELRLAERIAAADRDRVIHRALREPHQLGAQRVRREHRRRLRHTREPHEQLPSPRPRSCRSDTRRDAGQRSRPAGWASRAASSIRVRRRQRCGREQARSARTARGTGSPPPPPPAGSGSSPSSPAACSPRGSRTRPRPSCGNRCARSRRA